MWKKKWRRANLKPLHQLCTVRRNLSIAHNTKNKKVNKSRGTAVNLSKRKMTNRRNRKELKEGIRNKSKRRKEWINTFVTNRTIIEK